MATSTPPPPDSREDKIRSLELAIEEQRRDYDVLIRLLERTVTKIYTLLGAGLALLTYLYGSAPGNESSFAKRLFIPQELYGIILYFFALGIFLGSIALLLFALKSPFNIWTAFDNDQDDHRMDDYQGYLRYMKKRYLRVSTVNIQSYKRKESLYNLSWLPLVLSGILLLLIKTFGG